MCMWVYICVMTGVIVPCIIIFYMYIIHVLYTCCDCLFVCLTCRCVLLFRMWVILLFLIQLVCYIRESVDSLCRDGADARIT